MAVHVRLARRGNAHRPFYHIVAADHKMRRDGRFIEKLGYYDPGANPSIIEVKADRVAHWFENGAQLSPTVEKLLKVKDIKLSRKQAKAKG